MRKIPLPYDTGWIGLPDIWLGKHTRRRDEAAALAREKNLPPTLADFSIALSLLEDWGDIPGLSGNPENWNLEEVPWLDIAFINGFVFGDITKALEVPKNSSRLSQTGSQEKQTTAKARGNSKRKLQDSG